MTTVTEKIKTLCAGKNISAEDLAAGAGLKVEQVNRILDDEIGRAHV